MIPVKRQTMIYDLIKEKGATGISELSALTGASAMTIRRDLEKLEEEGLLVRSHGGAQLSTDILKKEVRYDEKELENAEGKERIAAAAAGLVKAGHTVLLDAGTTTYRLAKRIKDIPDLTVITPDIKIAIELCDSLARVIILGGEIQKVTKSVFNPDNLEFIGSLNFDIAFLGTSSISDDFILCTPTYEKMRFKKEFIRSAVKTVLLADTSKFYSRSVYKICSLSCIDSLITDKRFSKEEMKLLSEVGFSPEAIINV